ncbi:MAG: DUF554 domain-containing protein [Oscillospiraceae bacterium]|nr:DUF554 domain-containing protein [Oscillospiraceae bacterium]
MPGLGTLINAAGIIIGGFAGLLFGKLIKPRMQETMTCACGICVIFLGIAGAMEKMLTAHENGTLVSGGTMMVIASVVLGAHLGELINIEAGLERFGGWLKKVTHSEGDGGFIDGFVNASLTVCIGAMAVVGAIQDGIYGDYSTLTAKAVLDFIIVMIMTSAKGKGCIFSAIPVIVFQGVITALSRLIEPIMTAPALSNLSLVGSILIFCVGVNLVWGKKVRVANFLPGIVFAVACAYLPWF